MSTVYDTLALEVFFSGKVDSAKHGLEYRKGKTVDDVVKARDKALKNGQAKTEVELDMFGLYLKDVFKMKKKVAST